MAVEVIKSFDDWYDKREEDRNGKVRFRNLTSCAARLTREYEEYKREMEARTAKYHELLALADAEVITQRADLPNVSSGETSGMVLRMARNLVQNTPNVEVLSKHDESSAKGIIVKHILKTRIIGDNLYSNDMQQNLFASTKNALTLGFDCVIPVLRQDSTGSWMMKYDSVFYRDVFPEPGAKDIRDANDVFIRRYLTKGDIVSLCRRQVSGWDVGALKALLDSAPRPRDPNSVDHQSQKHRYVPEGYEIITWYSNSGDPFLTFCPNTKLLLRIEKNKHPLKEHPVFFLVLEKDSQQPLGKSQVERIIGRQEFQDLMLNGAMKMWYRNINPSIIGYGTTNAVLNLSPGKFNQINNPNARVEAFEVNTQTLMQFSSISQMNAANMIQQTGAADQQMASQNTGGMMSQTPQGVEAQQQMVDITTNNYQKAIESFFSRYCAYALTLYFHELKSVKKITPSEDARQALLRAEFPISDIDPETGEIEIDFAELATEYYIHTVPGSLVEMEDQKQLRILNELFVPLSQAINAVAASGDQAAFQRMVAAMQYIVEKQLELSGSVHAKELKQLLSEGPSDAFNFTQTAIGALENSLSNTTEATGSNLAQITELIREQQQQIALLAEGQALIAQRLGGSGVESTVAPTEITV